MDFQNLKIGYVPYLNDMSQPGNRRRFPYFARRKNIPFEIADTKSDYDIVLLTCQGDLTKWLQYKKSHPGTRFIFEMTDSVIFSADIFRTIFKGSGRYLLGREKMLYFNYKTPVKKWLSIADVAICSSREVKAAISHFNKNVVISLDYLQSEYHHLKNTFVPAQKLKLVWEGLGVSLHHLQMLKAVFRQVSSFCELHIITTESFPGWGNLGRRNVQEILRQLPINTEFHPWHIDTKDKILAACDLGIIPIDRKNKFAWHKPANKLVSFWFTGLPTLVTNTPAYVDMMDDAGKGFYCSDSASWVAKINEFSAMTENERKILSEKNYNYVAANCSDESLDEVWAEIFNMLC